MADSSKAVFLSYASQDADAARKLCHTLRPRLKLDARMAPWRGDAEIVASLKEPELIAKK